MRGRLAVALPLAAALWGLFFGSSAPAQGASLLGRPVAVSAADTASLVPTGWRGRSGALRAVLASTLDALSLPLPEPAAVASRFQWAPLFEGAWASGPAGEPGLGVPTGLHAPAAPGIWQLQTEQAYAVGLNGLPELTVITRVPFSAKRDGKLNGYRIGTYPTEGSGRTDRYAPPAGFIEVTRENQDFQISEHFRLRQFLTKDQFNVWPKYLVLDLRLIDKLELVLQELNAMGIRADRMHVMSGYRTPQYNGPGEGGRARLSRHTYGDAADVWVDSDGNGYIDDLNGDGRTDVRDAEVMLRAVERVEQRYPELVGGAGVYDANSAHGPFVHIDVRGNRARW